MKSVSFLLPLAVTTLCATLLTAQARPLGPLLTKHRFQLVNIGENTGGDYATAYSLNDAGQVVGAANTAPGSNYSAYIYDTKGGLRFLPSLPGSRYTQAESINKSGQIIGTTTLSNNNSRALLWTAQGAVVDLHPGPEWTESVAFSINDRGIVNALARGPQGTFNFLYDVQHGYRFQTNFSVTAINTRGAWVGRDGDIFTGDPVFAKKLDHPLHHIVTPGIYGTVRLIADDGLIAGYYYTNGYQETWILNQRHEVVTLRKLPGAADAYPLGINNHRQIAGSSGFRAAVWDHRRVLELNDAVPSGTAWRFLSQAFDINNKGAIAGVGFTTNSTAAFLLVPKGKD